MGHIVNATAFRLGRSVKHQTILSNKLDNRYLKYYQRNLLILQFIKTFFSAYSFTASSENIRKLTEDNINENFLKRLKANYFVSNSFLFSHANMQRGSILNLNVYLYDSGLEKIRTNLYKFVKYTPSTFFKQRKERRNWASNMLNLIKPSKHLYKNKWLKKLRIPFKYFSKRYFLPPRKKRVRYLYVMKTQKQKQLWWPKSRKYYVTRSAMRYKAWKKDLKTFPKPKHFYLYPKAIKTQYYRGPNAARMPRFYPTLSIYPGNKMRLLLNLAPRKRFLLVKILCKTYKKKYEALTLPILRFLLQGLVKFIKPRKKQRLYKKSHNKFGTNSYFSYSKKKRYSTKRLRLERTKRKRIQILLFKLLYLLRIKEYSSRTYKLFFFRKIIKLRLLTFRTAFELICGTLTNFESDLEHRFKIGFHALQYRTITAQQICNFISVKLGQYFKLYEVQSPILHLLKKNPGIAGFRILIVGRLTRKERGAYILRQHGSIPLNAKDKFVDYAADHKILKFGLIGIKVWLYSKRVDPFFYSLTFDSKLKIKEVY